MTSDRHRYHILQLLGSSTQLRQSRIQRSSRNMLQQSNRSRPQQKGMQKGRQGRGNCNRQLQLSKAFSILQSTFTELFRKFKGSNTREKLQICHSNYSNCGAAPTKVIAQQHCSCRSLQIIIRLCVQKVLHCLSHPRHEGLLHLGVFQPQLSALRTLCADQALGGLRPDQGWQTCLGKARFDSRHLILDCGNSQLASASRQLGQQHVHKTK